MTQTALALKGYSGAAGVARSPRRAEADVFRKVAQALAAAESSGDRAARTRALHDNTRLWNTAAILLADDANALPAALRAQLLGLAAFVERHTGAVLRGVADASALVEINHRIHAGLSGGEA